MVNLGDRFHCQTLNQVPYEFLNELIINYSEDRKKKVNLLKRTLNV